MIMPLIAILLSLFVSAKFWIEAVHMCLITNQHKFNQLKMWNFSTFVARADDEWM